MWKRFCLLSLLSLVTVSSLGCPRDATITFENRSANPTTEFFVFPAGEPRGDNLLSAPVPGGGEQFLGTFPPGTYEAAATVDVPNKGVRDITWDPFVLEAGVDWTLFFMDGDVE